MHGWAILFITMAENAKKLYQIIMSIFILEDGCIQASPVSNRIFLYFRPSHQSLKSRDRGQGDPEDLAGRNFRRELEEPERKVIDEAFCY